jgi:hypothetical protein
MSPFAASLPTSDAGSTGLEVIDTLVNSARRAVERVLPWYDPADRQRRAKRTEQIHRRAIAARIDWEHQLAAYLRLRSSR